MKYRYILNGTALPDDKLSDFRLIGANQIHNRVTAIRITLPDNIVSQKYSCDNYSTTEYDIPLKELSPVVICKRNGRFKEMKVLTVKWLLGDVKPFQFVKNEILVEKFGVITSEQYRWYCDHYKEAQSLDHLPNPKGIIS